MGPAAAVVGAWVFIAAGLIALGGLLEPDCGSRDDAARSAHGLFWRGYLLLIVLLQPWQLLRPVNASTYWMVAPLVLAGAARLWSKRRDRTPTGIRWDARLGALIACVLVSWTALRALARPGNPDTCLYYLQTVRWFEMYRAVPGLGNLHHRLAFNDSYFLFVALLDHGFFWRRAEHLANGVLLLSVAVPGAFSAAKVVLPGPRPRLSDFLWTLAFALSIDELLSGNLTSPAPDGAVWALDATLMLAILGPILDGTKVDGRRLRFIAALAAAGIATKPTVALIAGPFGLLALYQWNRDRERSSGGALTPIWQSAGLALAALVPWMARGLIFSGYPLFPATRPNFKLSWRVPEEIAQRERAYVQAYARYKSRIDYPLGNYSWRLDWLQVEWMNNRSFLIPFGALAIGLSVLIIQSLRRRRLPPWSAALGCCVCCLLAWFEAAPDTRFLGPAAWFACGLTVLAIHHSAGHSVDNLGRLPLVVLLGLVTGGSFIGASAMVFPRGFEDEPAERYVERKLPSGDVVHEDRGCCLEPPCGVATGTLRMRTPGNIQSGFYSSRIIPDSPSVQRE